MNLEKYQQETRKWRDKKVVSRLFSPGELVLLRTPRNKSNDKLEANWEGPYVVQRSSRPGAFKLADLEGHELEHLSNVDNLRKFYV